MSALRVTPCTLTPSTRMNRLGKPATNRVEFEFYGLAVSAINACATCIQAHERVLLEGGLTGEQVHDAVRIAAGLSAAAGSLTLWRGPVALSRPRGTVAALSRPCGTLAAQSCEAACRTILAMLRYDPWTTPHSATPPRPPATISGTANVATTTAIWAAQRSPAGATS